jgi:hypothetical protein
VGSIVLRDASAPVVLKTGEQVYQAQCAACHATGAAGAPKLGDAAAWGPRIPTGYDALLNSALKGKGAMGAQGGGEIRPRDRPRRGLHGQPGRRQVRRAGRRQLPRRLGGERAPDAARGTPPAGGRRFRERQGLTHPEPAYLQGGIFTPGSAAAASGRRHAARSRTAAGMRRRRRSSAAGATARLDRVGGVRHVQAVHQAEAEVGAQVQPAGFVQPAAQHLRRAAGVRADPAPPVVGP